MELLQDIPKDHRVGTAPKQVMDPVNLMPAGFSKQIMNLSSASGEILVGWVLGASPEPT